MPKLTLRDLFAVVTIVALALGWCVDHRRMQQDNTRLQAKFLEALAKQAYHSSW